MKRFMEQVSIDLGYGGRINEEVTKTANEKLKNTLATIETLNQLAQPNLKKGKNYETNRSDNELVDERTKLSRDGKLED